MLSPDCGCVYINWGCMAVMASCQPKAPVRKFWGKFIWKTLSEKQKPDKMLVNCGLPFPSTADNRRKSYYYLFLVSICTHWSQSPVFPQGTSLLGVSCFLQLRSGFPPPQGTPFIFLFSMRCLPPEKTPAPFLHYHLTLSRPSFRFSGKTLWFSLRLSNPGSDFTEGWNI